MEKIEVAEKVEVIMDNLGLSKAELKAMTTPDKDNMRLNKLFAMAQARLNEEADIHISQSTTLSLS